MRAYFLNSRTDRHGEVNVRLDDGTLDRFVGGWSPKNLVRIGDSQYFVIAEGEGRVSAMRSDGERLCGNLLVVAFIDLFEDRDMTDGDVSNVSTAFEDVEIEDEPHCVLMYERGEI